MLCCTRGGRTGASSSKTRSTRLSEWVRLDPELHAAPVASRLCPCLALLAWPAPGVCKQVVEDKQAAKLAEQEGSAALDMSGLEAASVELAVFHPGLAEVDTGSVETKEPSAAAALTL